MIFQHTHGLVLSGRKTQTRRVIGYGETIDLITKPLLRIWQPLRGKYVFTRCGRLKYATGNTYAVQPGRGEKAVGRIRITGMSIERLQNITEADARAEGVASIEEFQALWETIHGKKPGERWADNPLVVVIEFVCVEGMQS